MLVGIHSLRSTQRERSSPVRARSVGVSTCVVVGVAVVAVAAAAAAAIGLCRRATSPLAASLARAEAVARRLRRHADTVTAAEIVHLMRTLEDGCGIMERTCITSANQATMLATMEVWVKDVTARLEALEGKIGVTPPAPSAAAAPAAAAPAAAAAAPSGAQAAAVDAFDALMKGSLAPLEAAAAVVGGEVAEATQLLKAAFDAERTAIASIVRCKKPGNTQDHQKLIAPVGAAAAVLGKKTEGKRTDAFNHLKAAAEATTALFWVAYTDPSCGMSMPTAHVEESWQSAEFYNNKVLLEYRNKDETHVNWCKALKALFVELKAYVKMHHPTGPAWDPKGVEVAALGSAAAGSAAAPPRPPASNAPAPPPPPPPGTLTAPRGGAGAAAKPAGPGMSAVLSALNKGEAVTSGLKKVTDDMKTKNRADRSGAVPASASSAAASFSAAAAAPAVKQAGPPKLVLESGRKWVVENQLDNKSIVIEDTNPRQTVYVYNCSKSVIQVKGKVNGIVLDKCQRTGLVFEDVLAVCEVVNCSSVEVQCAKSCPTIAIDNCNGCQVYLSDTSKGACITTAKSSEVNVLVPGGVDQDLVETPLPEQFSSTFENGKWVTVPVTHSAG